MSSSSYSDSFVETPLIDSIYSLNYKLFLQLIEKEENLLEISEDNETPLMACILNCKKEENLKFLKKILEKIKQIDDSILLCTHNKICYNYLKKKINHFFDFISPNTKETMFNVACRLGDLDIVSEIYYNTELHKNVDDSMINCWLSTALNNNSNNMYEIINFLFNKFNNDFINSHDIYDNNFLLILENNINIEKNDKIKTIIIKILIDHNINIDKQNNLGKNILMMMIETSNINEWGFIYDYFLFYIKHNIKLHTKDINNWTIINYCIEQVNMHLEIKSKFNILKNNFKYMRKIINLIIEHKELNNNEKELLSKFKKNATSINLI